MELTNILLFMLLIAAVVIVLLQLTILSAVNGVHSDLLDEITSTENIIKERLKGFLSAISKSLKFHNDNEGTSENT